MSQAPLEVFTPDELARAAGVPGHTIGALIAAGELHLIAGTPFIAAAEAVRIGRRLRATPPQVALAATELLALANRPARPERERALPALMSTGFHTVLLLIVMWFTSGPAETAGIEAPAERTRLVFLMTPGPGGGGGGGGLRNPLPARRVERRGSERRASVPAVTPEPVLVARRDVANDEPPVVPAVQPKPVERAPEPPPAPEVAAPVVPAKADAADNRGVIEQGRPNVTSQGPGTAGGAGSGQGSGSGEGLGSGIGDGSGGGTGGGPYRPGSGIEPPRLLREVKAEYTEEARQRGLSGDVLLEIVVRSDGTVGDVRMLHGLGAGLDQRAVAAVRQWRFDPARRRGLPVDVLVEVAVEFTLR